jgi:hypothetical protein
MVTATRSASTSSVVSTFEPYISRVAVSPLEGDGVGDERQRETVGDSGRVVEPVDAVRHEEDGRRNLVVQRLDGLCVDVVVELLAVVDGVDVVDAVTVELGGELVDVAGDDSQVEIAIGRVGQFAARGDELEAHLAEVPTAVFGDCEDVAHWAPTPFSRRTSAS